MAEYDGKLVQALREKQAALGLSNDHMAARLGINRETYRRILSGEGGVSIRTLRAVLQVYPDLAEAATSLFLPPDASFLASSGSEYQSEGDASHAE